MPTNNAINSSFPVGPTQGGTGISTYATGDILYASAANVLSKLAAGTNGNVLTLAAGIPSWALPSALASFQIFTSGTAQTYTLPAGIKTILVECLGAGGGGGGVDSGAGKVAAAGGGGAGGYSRKFYSSPSATYTYTVAGGGAGGTAGVNNGSTGGTTTFDTISCVGGTGGPGDTSTVAAAHVSAGNIGFGGGASGGDINVTGSSGAYGVATLAGCFSGGGGSAYFGGGGGAGFCGGGVSVAGNAGAVGGGGGGAASANISSNKAGGNGGDGIIIVWQFA